MKTAIITWLVLRVLCLLMRLGNLAFESYPRETQTGRRSDVLAAFINVLVIVWLAILLARA